MPKPKCLVLPLRVIINIINWDSPLLPAQGWLGALPYRFLASGELEAETNKGAKPFHSRTPINNNTKP
ncbi:hypothetical protein Sinac_5650 [Singulisphaera acidiphila DSM 18658]|uniref:Uncharacterized protein n=1 Tax=Singulisphaera acidiphila (strain ATCC BAA-1392 / DSM 18658 / VKM B-2454 / MOB10) TaxID=886293 RepID=L0DM67_SINAD|nr:hypothetical protein Sinac_5650 [Singulisphaera acidiphila DSM 18658]